MVIPYAKQNITEGDISAVVEVLKSDYLTQGPIIPRFEEAICHRVKSGHAIAVNSATSALHITCLALGLGEGDSLWTTPQSFVASANCALYCKANVDFVDISQNTRNLCIDRLEDKLKQAEIIGALPKIIVTVHLSGYPTNLDKLNILKKKYGFYLIEDASHALGAKFFNSPIGQCKYSDCTIFSFHPVKIITTGEGGCVTTNCDVIAEKLRRLRTHGISGNNNDFIARPQNEIWNFQQLELGFNYRMTDISGALGLSQLKRLDQILDKRNQISDCYDKYFANEEIVVLEKCPKIFSSIHLYQVELPARVDQKKVYINMRKRGILVNVHYIPIYLHPYFEGLGFNRGYCPNSERFFQHSLSLPMYPELSAEDIKHVASTLITEIQ